MQKKITFVLNVKFPTEKAYGVTTSLTASAIQSLKKFDVEIITPILDKDIVTDNSVVQIKMPFEKIYWLLMNANLIKAFAFKVWIPLYFLKLKSIVRKEDNLIWVRDIFLALMFNIVGYSTVCEIHRKPNKINMVLFKILTNKKDNVFLFITEKLRNSCKSSALNSEVAPMSVKQSEILIKKYKKKSATKIVGYVGASHSSGVKLNLETLIQAANLLKVNHNYIEFRIYGIDSNSYSQKFPSNIEFSGRVPRSKIMEIIDTFDVGIVLYPNSKYYEDSFPIKIVEYAARQIPIVASRTISHQSLLGVDKAEYFESDSGESLSNAILRVLESDFLTEKMTLNSYKWVKNLTYERRIQGALLRCGYLTTREFNESD
jgi:glycosyltransferase involved in cell wall biosynthesis